MAICEIKDITFTYPEQEQPALKSINLEVEQGDFVVLFGESGSGKTTLLRMLKAALTPYGTKEGVVRYNGVDIQEWNEREAAREVGFVMQNPDTQIVTDKVWHELAFGLENLGTPPEAIRRYVAEIANYFGIHTWFRKQTTKLSGGEKQLLNVASIMAMQPNLLVLDEPTSQLDPIAASNFLHMLEKLNRDLGLTIVMSEHRLEEVLPLANKVVFLEDGEIICAEEPKNIGRKLQEIDVKHRMMQALPTAVQVFHALEGKGETPLTVREGRRFLSEHASHPVSKRALEPASSPIQDEILVVKQAWFRYERQTPDIVRGASLSILKGELISILGGNGSGKTTFMKLLAGQEQHYSGNVNVARKTIHNYKNQELYRQPIEVLPQEAQTVFTKATVKSDYEDIAYDLYNDPSKVAEKIQSVADTLSMASLLNQHPYDLSGGEQQKAALGKLLLLEPAILLLDEPTKGLDAFSKQVFREILQALQLQGKTIVINTHDIEFAAEVSDRVGLFFDGTVVSLDTPERFFSLNTFYTTAASRMSRHLMHEAVTAEAIVNNWFKQHKSSSK